MGESNAGGEAKIAILSEYLAIPFVTQKMLIGKTVVFLFAICIS